MHYSTACTTKCISSSGCLATICVIRSINLSRLGLAFVSTHVNGSVIAFYLYPSVCAATCSACARWYSHRWTIHRKSTSTATSSTPSRAHPAYTHPHRVHRPHRRHRHRHQSAGSSPSSLATEAHSEGHSDGHSPALIPSSSSDVARCADLHALLRFVFASHLGACSRAIPLLASAVRRGRDCRIAARYLALDERDADVDADADARPFSAPFCMATAILPQAAGARVRASASGASASSSTSVATSSS